MALTAWNDPGNQELTQEWREIRIMLATTSDPQARVPPRYCGETKLDLNSSYLRKGMETDEGLVWFIHLTQLPNWANEKETVILKGARWVEKEVFDSITRNVISMEKEIKLEDRNRDDGKHGSRDIFPKDKEVWFCTFEKNTKVFRLKSLTEFIKEAEEQRRPKFDRSLKPKDPVYERQKKELDYVKETSVKNTGTRHSRMVDDEFARNVSNPVNRHYREVDVGVNMTTREKYDRTVRNVSNSGNMDQNENVGVNMNNREGYDRMARNVGNSRNIVSGKRYN